ncbi:hypothetical protein LX32DRAFT_499570, partial [Colletotrichum zoysiae]
YGPAECTVWCIVQGDIHRGGNEANTGFEIGSKVLVVHPPAAKALMPPDQVGGLFIEGHLLVQGYLN